MPESRLHFLDMPFYETGRVRKKPLGEEDIQLTVELLRQIQPHQVYAAGDLSDPHGTHRTCLAAVLKACEQVSQDETGTPTARSGSIAGPGRSGGPHQIEMAVPLSPQELLRKRAAIFKHESQKDQALFPGPDLREFWQRAEDRNRGHGPALRPARPGRVRSDRGLRAVEGRVAVTKSPSPAGEGLGEGVGSR